MPIKEKLFEDKYCVRRIGGSRMKEGQVFKRNLNKEEIRNKLNNLLSIKKIKSTQEKEKPIDATRMSK